jgi:predicted dehydrogenase
MHATLARRVVAVGFVDRPTGDHHSITPSLHHSITPSLHHSITPPLHHSTFMSLPISLPTSRIEPAGEAPALRWGIMGPGWIAERFIESVRAHTRQDIVAVGSRDKKRAEEFASRMGLRQAYGDYKELVDADDLDVIYVATPHNFHHASVILALNAGKHVLVEKPIALNRAQAFEMVELARRKKLFFAEALWTFYLPKFDVLRQLLEAKVIGEIKSVYTDFGEYFTPDHRIFDPKLAGGPLLDLGTYPVSLLTNILGVPAQVIGLGQANSRGVIGQLSAILTDASGNQGTVSTSLYGFTPTNAIIIGTEGTICFESPFHLPGGFAVVSADRSQTLRYEEPYGEHFEGLYYEAAEVARRITSGELETPYRTLDASLATMAALDMIRHSIGIDFSAAGLLE